LNISFDFSQRLLLWYDEHKRDLPWRGETDPYKIWISEVILQQTRVNQGWDYYLKIVQQFPTVKDLAAAQLEEVLYLWQGLGYYSRARNLHTAAQQIMSRYGGVFPTNYDEVIQLKGIGEYTAAAICSIAYNQPYFAIDGNVFRVICRIFGILEDIQLRSTKTRVHQIGTRLMKDVEPALFTQAMMEFGAIHCVPKNPDCETCPFQRECYAYQEEQVSRLPLKINKIKIKNRYFHYFIFSHNDQIVIEKRENNDIWSHLYQFPLFETKGRSSKGMLQWLAQYGVEDKKRIKLIETCEHKLTHQNLHISFYDVEPVPKQLSSNQLLVSVEELTQKPFPVPIQRFINSQILNLL